MTTTNLNAKVGSILTPEMINKAAAQVWGVEVEDLFKKTRRREIVEPRQVIQYYRYSVLSERPGRIATDTKVNHATVIHAAKTMADLLETDKYLKHKYTEFENLLK